MKIYGTTLTTDGYGDATHTSLVPIYGRIKAVIVDLGSGTSSVDVKITPAANTGTNFEILNVTGVTSDDIFYPRVPADDKSGTNVTYDGTNEIYVEHVISGHIAITIDNGGSSKSVTVRILYV